MHNAIHEQANKFAQAGIVPIPLQYRSKKPIGTGWTNGTLERLDVEADFSQAKNIGVLLGESSEGLVDIDLDCNEAVRIADRYLPETELIWGRKGRPNSHWLYKVTDCGRSEKLSGSANDGMLVEYRSTGAQTVAPPSIHPSGEDVYFAKNGEPTEVTRPSLLSAVSRLAAASLLAKHWAMGLRHDLALALAGWLCKAGWDAAQISFLIESICIAAGDSEVRDRLEAVMDTCSRSDRREPIAGISKLEELLDNKVLEKVMQWLELDYVSNKSSCFDRLSVASDAELGLVMTDQGNADLFIEQYGGKLRHCPEIGWLHWTGKLWKEDANTPKLYVQEQAKSLFDKVKQLDDSAKRDQFYKFAKSSNNFKGLQSALEVAKPRLTISQNRLDKHPNHLNCANGLLDLSTGHLEGHTPGYFITHMVPVSYDPHAECPTFKRFLKETFSNDEDLIEFVQRALGYSLTGSTAEQCFFIAYGTGANGKSTLMTIISEIQGDDLSKNTPVQTLNASRSGSSVPNDLARLRGARFVIASEAEANQKMAEGLIKQITGGEKITARYMRQEFFEFEPEFKLWLGTNFKPQFSGNDQALWRRIRLIPFDNTVAKSEQDPELLNKLREEKPGILRWLVEGSLKWHNAGLGSCSAVDQATSDFKMEMDYLQQFLDECVELTQSENVPKSEMHEAYSQWCIRNGYSVCSKGTLTQDLKRLGLIEGRNSKERHWKGIRLVNIDHDFDQVFDEAA